MKVITFQKHFGIPDERLAHITKTMADIMINFEDEYAASPVDDRALWIEKIRDFDGTLEEKLLIAMGIGAADEYMKREGNALAALMIALKQRVKEDG